MEIINLKNSDKVCVVSECDVAYVKQFTWAESINGYAQRPGGIFMHRDIIYPGPYQVHHIDGNKLNNQRNNLLLVTQAQNGQARKLQKNNSSGYRGVVWQRPSWKAQIYVNRKRICLGCFVTPEDAANAYNNAALKHFGTVAKLNIIANKNLR